MATVYFTKPVTSDLRADVLAYLRDAINSQARMFEGDTLVSPPVNAIRYVAANNRFEKWDGALWNTLNITGNVAPTPPGGLSGAVQYNNGAGGFAGASNIWIDNPNTRLYVGVNASNDVHTWVSGHDGLTTLSGTAAGGWARGLVHRRQDTHAITAGVGFYGANEIVQTWRVGFGASWYDQASAVNGFMLNAGGNASLSTGEGPEAWHTDYRALEIGQKGTAIWNGRGSSNLWFTANAYYNGSSQFIYANNGGAWAMNLGPGNDNFTIRRAAVGTAGNTISWATMLSIDSADTISNGVTDSGTVVAHFKKNGASAYGKVMLLSCTGSTDGPQVWYRRDGVSEWGVGMLASTNDFGFQYGGHHGSFGTTHMYLGSGGGMVLSNGTFTAIKNTGGSDYTNYNIEVRTGAGDAGIGFHNGGANAGTLLFGRSTGYFEFRSNPVSSYITVRMGNLFTDGYIYGLSGNALNAYGGIAVRGEKNGYAGVAFARSDGTYMFTFMCGTDRNYMGIYDEARGAWPLYTSSFTSSSKTWYWEGNLVMSQNITAYSDARDKKNVETLRDSLDKVLRMRGVSYERISTGTTGIGVIAQEMLEVEPEVVHHGEDRLSVAYGNLAGHFIEAIKELHARIERLEARHG